MSYFTWTPLHTFVCLGRGHLNKTSTPGEDTSNFTWNGFVESSSIVPAIKTIEKAEVSNFFVFLNRRHKLLQRYSWKLGTVSCRLISCQHLGTRRNILKLRISLVQMTTFKATHNNKSAPKVVFSVSAHHTAENSTENFQLINTHRF